MGDSVRENAKFKITSQDPNQECTVFITTKTELISATLLQYSTSFRYFRDDVIISR